jgi:hypothetical protein
MTARIKTAAPPAVSAITIVMSDIGLDHARCAPREKKRALEFGQCFVWVPT